MTVWGYIRVSGDEQADRGLPVAGQRRELERYAEGHGLSLSRVYVDEARSGGTDRREQFQLMMERAHGSQPPEAILLWSWSRFSRDQTDAHFWKASLRRHGVKLVDVSGETPEVEGFEYVLESLIHWKDEQKLLEVSRNARRGQQMLAAMGYVPSGCSPPRGYRVEFEESEIEGRKRRLRRWVPDSEWWPQVQRAWRMRLEGRSYREILKATGLYRAPGGLSSFYANPAYKGAVSFGGTIIPVEAAVTPEEWAKVNAERKERRSGAWPRRQGSRFLLSGLLECARCGGALCAANSPGGMRGDGYVRQRWDCYVCLRARRHECDLPRLGAMNLERAVTEAVFEDILTEANLTAQLARIARERDAERPVLEARLEATTRELSEIDLAIGRLLDAIEQVPDSAALTSRLSARERDRERLEEEVAGLRARLSESPSLPDVAAIRESLRTALEDGSVAEARLLLRRFVDRIVVDTGTLRLFYRVPL